MKMKKYIALMLVCLMVLVPLGCQQEATTTESISTEAAQTETVTDTEASQESDNDGSFTGTAEGYGGEVSVTLTIENGEITAATATGDGETASIGGNAIAEIPQQMVERNSVKVDTYSGATVTSEAILLAAEDALGQAGLSPDDLSSKEVSTAPEQAEYDTDVLVIGAGGAGLTAANAAIERGAENVIVIEKMPFVGGASAQAGGLVGGGSKLQEELGLTGDSPDLIYEDLMRGGYDTNKPELLRLMADNMGETLDWLIEDLNVPINDRYPSDFPEHTVQRFFIVDGGSTSLTDTLANEFENKGGTLLFEMTAKSLLTEDGAVIGAMAEDKHGNEITFNAKKTIIATGGFGNNPDMLSEDVQKAVFYGVASSMGDGHKMAEAVGAHMTFMEYAKMYPQGISMEGTNSGKVDPMSALTTTNSSGAIYVNLEGERVIDENLDFVSIKHATEEQTDQVIFLVMDQAGFDIWSKSMNDQPSPAGHISYEDQEKYFNETGKRPIFARGSVEEAAEIAGIDPTALAQTIADWNTMVDAGEDTSFGREELMQLDDSKIYIVEQRLRFATTLGGIDVNDKLEALTVDGDIIPNLYAAGEVVGGANGIEAMPGCMLSWAVNSGRFAGYNAVDELQ